MATITNYNALGLTADWTNVDTVLGQMGEGIDDILLKSPTKFGNIFYVSSVDGSDNNDGLSWDTPFATIDHAVGHCEANHGDIILVLPNHVETFTGTGCTVDVAGVSVIGLKSGTLMPQIKHNHANAEVSISADNVLWQGIRHTADVTDVLVAIEIEDGADYCTVRKCQFDVVATGTDEFAVCVRTNDATNFPVIEDNVFDMGLGGAVAAVSFTKDSAFPIVRRNYIQGDFSTACIQGITTLSTKVLIENNLLINGISGDLNAKPAIQLLTNSTGVIRDNDIVCNLTTMAASVVADQCFLFRNYYNEDVTGTGTIFGTASADD